MRHHSRPAERRRRSPRRSAPAGPRVRAPAMLRQHRQSVALPRSRHRAGRAGRCPPGRRRRGRARGSSLRRRRARPGRRAANKPCSATKTACRMRWCVASSAASCYRPADRRPAGRPDVDWPAGAHGRPSRMPPSACLEGAQARACLAARAARRDARRATCPARACRARPAGRRPRRASSDGGSRSCIRLPGDRPQRDDERVDAHVDRPPAALDGELRGPRPCRGSRRSTPGPRRSAATARSQAAKYASMPQRALPGATRASTAGSKVSTWMPTESMPMSATWSMTSRSDGRLELHLDRQPGRLLDRLPAAPDVQRAAVGGCGAAGGQRRVDRAVELPGGHRDLGQHGRASSWRSCGQRPARRRCRRRRTGRRCPSRRRSAAPCWRPSPGAAARSASTACRRRWSGRSSAGRGARARRASRCRPR